MISLRKAYIFFKFVLLAYENWAIGITCILETLTMIQSYSYSNEINFLIWTLFYIFSFIPENEGWGIFFQTYRRGCKGKQLPKK